MGLQIKKRILWVDYVKSTSIILMVLCHAGLDGIPHQVIYSFHMPFFFIISGYLYKPNIWYVTLKKLLIPIFIFSIIMLGAKLLMRFLSGNVIELDELIWLGNYYRTTGKPALFTGQWFIFTLIICRFLLGDIRIFKKIRDYYKLLGLLLLVWMSIQQLIVNSDIQYYYFYLSFAALPFLCFGIFVREKGIDFFINIGLVPKLFLLFIFFFICFYNGKVDMSGNCYGTNYLFFFIGAISAFILFVSFINSFKKNNNIIETFSIGTLVIMGTHSFVFLILRKIVPINDSIHPMMPIFYTVVALSIAYPLIRWGIKKVPFLLGK